MSLTLAFLVVAMGVSAGEANPPIELRAESLTVPPDTGPLMFVAVRNPGRSPYDGVVRISPPEGWRLNNTERTVQLKPGESKRIPFRIERGRATAENSYPFEISATADGAAVTRRQHIVCASAPYFKPTIDGKIDDWKDAIPAAFTTGGKRTTIRTFWSRRRFSILAAVEEEKLIAFGAAPFDAVQLAISPAGAAAASSEKSDVGRFEFLLAASSGDGQGKCFRLAQPGMSAGDTQKVRDLDALIDGEVELAVVRSGGVTYYECGIPFAPMRESIRPSEGREFCLSVLVHDPDGTGVRDWGAAAGLSPSRRNRLDWSRWPGAKWGEKPPCDCRLEWGMCSSKY